MRALLLGKYFVSLLSLCVVLFFVTEESLSDLLLAVLATGVIEVCRAGGGVHGGFRFLQVFIEGWTGLLAVC